MKKRLLVVALGIVLVFSAAFLRVNGVVSAKSYFNYDIPYTYEGVKYHMNSVARKYIKGISSFKRGARNTSSGTRFIVKFAYHNSKDACDNHCFNARYILDEDLAVGHELDHSFGAQNDTDFRCHRPGAERPTRKDLTYIGMKSLKKSKKWRYYYVRLDVKPELRVANPNGRQSVNGVIKKQRKYSFTAVPITKDGKSLDGKWGLSEQKKWVYYGDKGKMTRKSIPKKYATETVTRNGKKVKITRKFIGWSNTKNGKIISKATTINRKITKKTVVYAVYEKSEKSDPDPEPEYYDCDGIETPSDYRRSNEQDGWTVVKTKVRDTEIEKYAEWQDLVYSKPKDNVEWIHCYYPGVQYTANTTVSLADNENREGALVQPTTHVKFSSKGWSNKYTVSSDAWSGSFSSETYSFAWGNTEVQSVLNPYDVLMNDVNRTLTEKSNSSPSRAHVDNPSDHSWGCHWKNNDSRCGCVSRAPYKYDKDGKVIGGGECLRYGNCYVDTCRHGSGNWIGSSKSGETKDDAIAKIPYNFKNRIVITDTELTKYDESEDGGYEGDDGPGDSNGEEIYNNEIDMIDGEGDFDEENDEEDSDIIIDGDEEPDDESIDDGGSDSSVGGGTGENNDLESSNMEAANPVFAGETKNIPFDIYTIPRLNETTEGTYATRVDNAYWKVVLCIEETGDCRYGEPHAIPTLNEGESDEQYFDGSVWSKDVSVYVPDVNAGSHVIVKIGVYPKDSGEDTNLSPYYYSIDNEDSWEYGQIRYVVAKRPSIQVWGGNVFSTNSIETAVSWKRALKGYNDNDYTVEVDGSLGNHVFGSWAELGVIAISSTQGFASGASTNVWDQSRNYWVGSNKTNFCDRVPLTIANVPCGGTTSSMGGIFTGGGADDDRSRIIDKFVDKGTLTSGDKEVGEKVLNKGDLYVELTKGNIYISGNIRYSGRFNKLKDVPKAVLYAEGDIYISCDVKELNALLVAGGTVKTCADRNGNEPDVNSVARSNQLRVNGAVIASEFVPGRTYGAATGNDTGTAAEVINFDPTLYLWGGDSINVNEDYNAGTLDVKYIQELAPRL